MPATQSGIFLFSLAFPPTYPQRTVLKHLPHSPVFKTSTPATQSPIWLKRLDIWLVVLHTLPAFIIDLHVDVEVFDIDHLTVNQFTF